MLEQKPLASAVYPTITILQSNRICSLLTSVTFSFPMPSRFALKTCLYEQYHNKWYLLTPAPPLAPPLPLPVTLPPCYSHVCMCACGCGVQRIHCYDYIIIHFGVFSVYIFVDLVKCGVLTLVGEIRHWSNDCYCYYCYTCPCCKSTVIVL